VVLATALVVRPHKPGPRRAIAVLDPRDAAPRTGSTFVSGALGELLADELSANPQVRLIAADLVQPALSDLGLARGAAIDAESAHRIERRLGAELVVGGSYELVDGRLHTTVELWGRGAKPLASFQEWGPEDALVPIAGRLGARLRAELGGGTAGQAPERTQGSFPANPEAARLYVLGLSQLRSYEAGAAVQSLEAAGRIEQGNPRIDAALTEAYLDLLRAKPAREAAARAMKRVDELPPDDRARFEILRARALPDKDAAIRLAKAWFAQAPDDVERGLALATLQIKLVRRPADALLTLAELRKLPPPAGTDPQIDLLEALASNLAGDLQRGAAAAERAYAAGKALGARRTMAMARHYGADSARKLGNDLIRARQMYREAEILFREVNDLVAAAAASSMQAALLADSGDLPGAKVQLESAFTEFGDAGDRIGEAATLHNLAIVLRRMRDLPGALRRAQQAYAIQLELDEQNSAANSLLLLGHLRQDVGDLAGAGAALTESARIRRQLKDPMLGTSLANLALVQLEQGDLEAARKSWDEAAAIGTQEKGHLAQLRETLGQILLAEGRYAESEAASREAAALATAAQQVDEAALCEAFLAQALLAQHKVVEAREAVGRGTALLAKSKNAIARGTLNVIAARVKAAEAPGDPSVVESLRAALEEATASGVVSDQWEARLALAELEPAESRAVVRTRLRSLAGQARAQGFGYYAILADSAARR
jgi:tetratricopeptide (TPR) repeat protein